jgi:hypothetical protein
MKPKIISITEPPKIAGLYIQQGFRDLQAVLKFALTHGYAEVYYWPKHQRIYVDRSKVLVEKARQVERQSKEVLNKVIAAVDEL